MEISNICHALGNRTRYQIIAALKNRVIHTCCDKIEIHENGISVMDVVKMTKLAQSTVSQHLAVLEKAGIIYKEKRDYWSCYFLNEKLLHDFFDKFKADLKI